LCLPMTHHEWLHNTTVWAGVAAWIGAQLVKLLISAFENRRFDHGFLLRLGGMPSSHSAAVCAVMTSIGIRDGFGGTTFAVALMLAIVVMIDAQSVRRAAGQQAMLLNQIVEELFKTHHFPQHKMVEFLGHTRVEVILGGVFGILIALLFHGLMPT
jgi:uncharacterized protein